MKINENYILFNIDNDGDIVTSHIHIKNCSKDTTYNLLACMAKATNSIWVKLGVNVSTEPKTITEG